MPQPSARNHRNNPYFFDEMLVRGKRTAAGVLWRFRTEAMVLVTGTAGIWELAKTVTTAWMTVILIMTATAITVVPQARRFITRRAWCVMSRHRIQKVCFETRMHTRTGRLPLVLRIHPTKVGERALIWCRAGICAADFEAHTPEIAAACYARQARVEGNRRWAQLVQVDIVRRDTLAAHTVIAPGVVRLSPNMEEGVMTRDDPLLAALADAARRKQRADHDIRLLLAYAREHTRPRPYRLADLAQAAGKSISGIRTAYSKADIDQAARLTGGSRGRHLLKVITSLLVNRQDAPACERHPAA
jgi:hypothetical protein